MAESQDEARMSKIVAIDTDDWETLVSIVQRMEIHEMDEVIHPTVAAFQSALRTLPPTGRHNPTIETMLKHLRAMAEDEPPLPDPEQHPGAMLEVAARHYDEWDRVHRSLRLLLGNLLVNEALDR